MDFLKRLVFNLGVITLIVTGSIAIAGSSVWLGEALQHLLLPNEPLAAPFIIMMLAGVAIAIVGRAWLKRL